MIQIFGVKSIPLIKEGDDLAQIISDTSRSQGLVLCDRDVIIVAQKIVSKAEGRILKLDGIEPSKLALKLSRNLGKDPRLLEVILGECSRIVRMKKKHLITQVRHGHICANSGVDTSNIEEGFVTLLPENPDRSAHKLRVRLEKLAGVKMAVIISDTCGRPFRRGQVNLAIGVSGIKPLKDYRGSRDIFRRPLTVTMISIADELASAAELVMSKADRIPVAVIRGYEYEAGEGSRDLIRPLRMDLFA